MTLDVCLVEYRIMLFGGNIWQITSNVLDLATTWPPGPARAANRKTGDYGSRWSFSARAALAAVSVWVEGSSNVLMHSRGAEIILDSVLSRYLVYV